MAIPSTQFVQLMTLGVMCILRTHGKTIEVNWTPAGVKPHRSYRLVHCLKQYNFIIHTTTTPPPPFRK